MLRSVFTDPQSFFDMAILSIFIKIFEFFKENKLYVFLYLNFFTKVKETSIHSESFLKFHSAHLYT